MYSWKCCLVLISGDKLFMSNPLDCRSRLNVARKLSILNGRIILNVRNSKMSKSMFLTNQPTLDMNFLSYNNEQCYEKTCLRGSDPVRHESGCTVKLEIKEAEGLYYLCSKNTIYAADLRLCFRKCKKQVFS